jgi:hypothetical protein
VTTLTTVSTSPASVGPESVAAPLAQPTVRITPGPDYDLREIFGDASDARSVGESEARTPLTLGRSTAGGGSGASDDYRVAAMAGVVGIAAVTMATSLNSVRRRRLDRA